MKERPKPNWLRRVAITMATVGAIGTAATIADNEITNNAIDENIDRAYPQIASFEEFVRAREAITIFDKETHQLVQQGEMVIDIPKITDSSKLQQAAILVSEYNKRQQKRSELQTQQHKNKRIRLAYVGTVSIGLVTLGIQLMMGGQRPQENRRKPTETLQQTSSTT